MQEVIAVLYEPINEVSKGRLFFPVWIFLMGVGVGEISRCYMTVYGEVIAMRIFEKNVEFHFYNISELMFTGVIV